MNRWNEKKKRVRIPSTCIYHFFNTETKSQKTNQTITSSQISFVKNISYLKPYATPRKSVILDLVGQYIHVAFCLKSLHQKYNFLPLKYKKTNHNFPFECKNIMHKNDFIILFTGWLLGPGTRKVLFLIYKGQVLATVFYFKNKTRNAVKVYIFRYINMPSRK